MATPGENVNDYIMAMKIMANRDQRDKQATMGTILRALSKEVRTIAIQKEPKKLSELLAAAQLAEDARHEGRDDEVICALKRVEGQLKTFNIANVTGCTDRRAAATDGRRVAFERGPG